MVRKNLAQTDLSDALIQHHQALDELDGINAVTDWSRLELQLSELHNSESVPDHYTLSWSNTAVCTIKAIYSVNPYL